jgi:hypothetical protein
MMSDEDVIRPWQIKDDVMTGPKLNFEIEVTDRDCVALADFTYDGEELPVFEVGDRLLLKQGGEAFFIWDLGHNVVYRTEHVQWLFYYLAFDFRVRRA